MLAQVYLASASPPVRYPNVYGVDMPTKKEFVAFELSEDQICEVNLFVPTIHPSVRPPACMSLGLAPHASDRSCSRIVAFLWGLVICLSGMRYYESPPPPMSPTISPRFRLASQTLKP
jgi:hypothetical protein